MTVIYLKEANLEDYEEEYSANVKVPYFENGFENKYANCSLPEYLQKALPRMIEESRGINIHEGRVPQTIFFLWDDDRIVGIFKLRHHLNDALMNGGGHVGYGILKEYRNKGYAKTGLKLLIDRCREIVREDELYLSAYKYNAASIKVMLANGAYLHHGDDNVVYMRIKL